MVAGQAVSPQGGANSERLREYWEHGAGAARIQWGVPGDFGRCVTELGKYIDRAEGYCAAMHIRVTGARTGHAPAELAAKAAEVKK